MYFCKMNDGTVKYLPVIDESFECLLIHTDVRRFSKFSCLNLWCRCNTSWETALSSNKDSSYLANIFNMMNEVKKTSGWQDDSHSMQRRGFLHCFWISAIETKMGRNILSNLPNLCESGAIYKEENFRYCSHWEYLIHDFEVQFTDLISLDFPSWIVQIFIADTMKAEQLIHLQTDEEAK